jgi:F-type H+-transporting ATPase subunit a
MIAALCLAAALSAEPTAEPEHKGVVDVVLDHVTDSRTIEFQMPWGPKYEFTPPEWKVRLGSHALDLSITKHVFFMWVAMLLLLAVVLPASRKRAPDEAPAGMAGAIEEVVLFVRGIAVRGIGEHDADRYTPYLCTIFFFVLFCGLIGVLPFTATATGNIAVTASLAICTFVLTQIAGMRGQGVVGYWTHLVPKGIGPSGLPRTLGAWLVLPFQLALYVIMLLVELVGLFTKPFALTVRLFANMIAGHLMILILLGLVFLLGSVFVAPVSIALALFVYVLELLVIGVQALIFTLLSATFIGMASHSH